MDYYSILNLKKEPFSNSPEPEFFYEAPKYIGCLQKLELAVRLRRGLNVVIGDVGTGKTTLCRKLIQQLSVSPKDSQDIETYLLLDPLFDNSILFLQNICMLIGVKEIEGSDNNEWQLKEKIKNHLFNKGVNDNKIVVLIIDEGQKIPENCIEILREFLNYETNSFKLLQINIFAQPEFKKILKKYENLADRINYFHQLTNLNFKNMRGMINYRIKVAKNFEESQEMFTFWAAVSIYWSTRGYPRKVVSLCHQILLMMIVRGEKQAGYLLVRDCINDMYSPLFHRIRLTVLSAVLMGSIILFFLQKPGVTISFYQELPGKMFSSAKDVSKTNESKPASAPAIISQNNLMVGDNSAVASAHPHASAETKDLTSIAKMPDTLGVITLKEGRTLWRAINNVYGVVNSETTAKLYKANPNISRDTPITVGQKIIFPSIPAEKRPVREGSYNVVIAQGNDLDKMYDLYQENLYKKNLPVMFLSSWNNKEGITFLIVLDTNYASLEAAKSAAMSLPADVASRARIVSQWEKNSIFFNSQPLKN